MQILKTITEGGQIWAHRVRMAKQVLKIASLTSFVLTGLFFLYTLTQIPAIYYQASAYYLKSQLFSFEDSIEVNSKTWGEITHQFSSRSHISLAPKTVEKVCKRHFSALKHQLSKNIEQTFGLGSYVFGGALVFFLVRGWRARKSQHTEGKRIVSSKKLALMLKLRGKASRIHIGHVPLVKGTETQHLLISGATGSGKTNAFHSLLPQIRKQRAIIVDMTGEFVEKYYQQDKDILLNPFDARTASWHPWIECFSLTDYKALAQSFIPSSYREEENFWRKGAQEVFASALRETSFNARTSSLAKLLLHDPLATLATVLKGSTATSYLDLSSEKTAGSIRAVASSFLECLEFIPDTEDPFSIRQWVNEEKQEGWLFLTCTPQQRASLIPLQSSWLSIGINSLLQLSPNHQRRLWFVIDELPLLNRLRSLENFLTESRKFGGCGLLAIQSPSQLESIYGKDVTSTLLGNCATRVAFAEYDPEIAYRISKAFGSKETKESQEAISYGSHEMRDGVNLSYQSKTSSVVSPTDLQSLNTHEAFLKLPGNLPITQIKLKLKSPGKIAEAFIPLPDR